jgi:hypothetical protein
MRYVLKTKCTGESAGGVIAATKKQISVEWMQNRGALVSAVIAGLDPAIHPFRKN